jgi:BirA family transcriptional regulator, biotin operon repressor / biotin---[acetyl-CoA-carboxylase] ligase
VKGRESLTERAVLVGQCRHALGDVGSTQDELARLAAAGAPDGTVVTAEHQTGGRGRRGRSWSDAPGENVLVSILLRPPVSAAEAPALSLVGAVAVVDALAATAGIAAGIRWPNDILIEGRKLAGILAEGVTRPDGRLQHALLGIGLNVNQTAFPPTVRDLATSLRIVTGHAHDRAALLDGLLAALDRRYRQFLSDGFAAMRSDWRAHSVTLGRLVRTADGLDAEAVDVDDDGALVLRANGGAAMRLRAGEIVSAPPA